MIACLKTRVRDLLARMLARLLCRFARDPRYFDLWQRHGFHVLPLHFYSPVPDTRELTPDQFQVVSALPGTEMNENSQLELLTLIRRDFFDEYRTFALRDQDTSRGRFRFGCGSIESVDAEVLYAMVRRFRPKRLIEIGTGYSTIISMEAVVRNARDGFPCEMISIDPFAPDDLLTELPLPLTVLRKRVQEVPITRFSELQSDDVLFIDSTHVCKIGSDVQFELLEVLPRLNPGVVVHIHDIFLPLDYPEEWVRSRHRFWNEQYLLQAFLCGNQDFEILWGGAWMHHRYPDRLQDAFPSYDRNANLPASFWIRKVR